MADAHQRSTTLRSWQSTLQAITGDVSIRELPLLTHLDLRLHPSGPAAADVASVLGAPVPTSASTAVHVGEIDVLWQGPDEWLILAPSGSTALEAKLRSAVGDFGAVTDVSAQRTIIRLQGPRARTVLAHGCSADLHPKIAPAGTCLETQLALTGITLVVRNDEGNDYWILVRSSFAPYLAAWLVDASVEYRSDSQ